MQELPLPRPLHAVCQASPLSTTIRPLSQVVFVKEGVAVWPSKQQCIMGRLSLVKQHCVMFLAWLPYSDDAAGAAPEAAAAQQPQPPPQQQHCSSGSPDRAHAWAANAAQQQQPAAAAATVPAGSSGVAGNGTPAASSADPSASHRAPCSGGSDGGSWNGAAAEAQQRQSPLGSRPCSPSQAGQRPQQPQQQQPVPERSLYAIHPVPLSDIAALTRHTPPLGWHYLVVVLGSGVTLPPLFFHQGGVRELLRCLKQHVPLARTSHDPNTYLVNDTADPLQRTLTSLELADILMGAPPPGASVAGPPPPAMLSPGGGPLPPPPAGLLSSVLIGSGGGGPPGCGAPCGGGSAWEALASAPPPAAGAWRRGLSEQLGDALWRVTSFARESASNLVSAVEGWNADQQQPVAQAGLGAGMPHPLSASAPTLQRCGSCPHDAAAACPLCSSSGAAPSAAISVPRRSSAPSGDRRLSSSSDAACGAAGTADAAAAADTLVGSFEMVEGCATGQAQLMRARARPPPLAADEFATYFNGEGVLVDEAGFRERVFVSGEWRLAAGLQALRRGRAGGCEPLGFHLATSSSACWPAPFAPQHLSSCPRPMYLANAPLNTPSAPLTHLQALSPSCGARRGSGCWACGQPAAAPRSAARSPPSAAAVTPPSKRSGRASATTRRAALASGASGAAASRRMCAAPTAATPFIVGRTTAPTCGSCAMCCSHTPCTTLTWATVRWVGVCM